jgi:hypothetical protein
VKTTVAALDPVQRNALVTKAVELTLSLQTAVGAIEGLSSCWSFEPIPRTLSQVLRDQCHQSVSADVLIASLNHCLSIVAEDIDILAGAQHTDPLFQPQCVAAQPIPIVT